ncbi:MAG: carboxypeptidase regulatory-like domain-containing protein [Firmicutes bacterium]|nr:carboxypeptidase regulatory-like domain-containing protein [Bacillota bacterium]
MRPQTSPSGAKRNAAQVIAAAYLLLAFHALAQPGTGTLAGVVLGPGNAPVAGARVILQQSDGARPRAVRADRAGRFRLHGLRVGLYDLRAQHGGMWSEWRHNVLVRANRETSVVLRLLSGVPAAEPAPLRLAGTVREWEIPVADAQPQDPAIDPAGNLWLTLMRANQLARLDPATGQWKLFTAPTPNSAPHGLVSDRAGNLWYTANRAGKIGRLDAASGQITEYNLPPEAGDPHTPVFGPDGALWFTVQRANQILRLDPQNGAVRSYPVPTPEARPYGIVVGPDQALWFCEFGTGKLGRLNPTTGQITEYQIPFEGAQPRRLVARGAAIYYTDFARGSIGQFDLVTFTFREWPSPSGRRSQPYAIAAGTDGVLWYTEFNANQLVRFDPETGAFTRFALPFPKLDVRHMVRDATGHIWMTLSGANKVARIE